MDYKFNYNNAELYISKYNTYGSRFFLLVDIENNTMFTGWTASTVATPRWANYFVLENTTQKEVKCIYKHKKALGYVELNPDEFQEALKNGRV
nr:MAG TPA: hypothetical protein [Caudoviricetes sp.]